MLQFYERSVCKIIISTAVHLSINEAAKRICCVPYVVSETEAFKKGLRKSNAHLLRIALASFVRLKAVEYWDKSCAELHLVVHADVRFSSVFYRSTSSDNCWIDDMNGWLTAKSDWLSDALTENDVPRAWSALQLHIGHSVSQLKIYVIKT